MTSRRNDARSEFYRRGNLQGSFNSQGVHWPVEPLIFSPGSSRPISSELQWKLVMLGQAGSHLHIPNRGRVSFPP